MAGVLFQMAQVAKGLPWFLPRSNDNWPYLNSTLSTSYAMDIWNFASANLTMEPVGSTVTFKYKFQDFRGTAAVFSGWEGLVKTRCQEIATSPNRVIPGLKASNFSDSPLLNSYRWVVPVPTERPIRNAPYNICKPYYLRAFMRIFWGG